MRTEKQMRAAALRHRILFFLALLPPIFPHLRCCTVQNQNQYSNLTVNFISPVLATCIVHKKEQHLGESSMYPLLKSLMEYNNL